jgi:hypothetical protein
VDLGDGLGVGFVGASVFELPVAVMRAFGRDADVLGREQAFEVLGLAVHEGVVPPVFHLLQRGGVGRLRTENGAAVLSD